MNKGKKINEGKAKIIYETKEKGLIIQHFKDDTTAFNNLKKAKIEGKGVINNRISEHLLNSLGQCGIKNHLIKKIEKETHTLKETIDRFLSEGLDVKPFTHQTYKNQLNNRVLGNISPHFTLKQLEWDTR